MSNESFILAALRGDYDETEEGSPLPETPVDESATPNSVNRLITDIYNYYYRKGYYPIFLESSLRIVSIVIVVLFSLFIVFFVDPSILNNATSRPLSEFIKVHMSFWFLLIALPGFAFTCFCIYREIAVLQKYHSTYLYFKRELRIRDSELNTLEWSEIVSRVGQSEIQTRYYITRDENYLTELYSQKIFKTTTQVSDFILRVLLGSIFFRNEIIYPTDVYEQRIIFTGYLCGLLSIALYPCIIFFTVAYFIFKYTLHVSAQTRPSFNLIDKEWIWTAKYIFRYTNELPHEYERRIAKTYSSAKNYSEQFYQESSVIIYKFIVFVLGIIATPLLLVSLYSDDILWYTTVYNHSLFWILSTLSIAILVIYSLIPQKYCYRDPKSYMSEILSVLKIAPLEWREHPERWKIYASFRNYFQYKFVIAFKEMIALLSLPYLLLYYIPKHSEEITNFFVNSSRVKDGRIYYKDSLWDEERVESITSERIQVSRREITPV